MDGTGKSKAEDDKSGMIEQWLKKHNLIYTGATRHPFILSIRDGTIDMPSFKRWLAQDYLFVRAFASLLASSLMKAWKESEESSDMEVILEGLASLNDEIPWFKTEASKGGVSLTETVPQKANIDYCRFLESLMNPDVEYTVVMTAIWAIEVVYQDSFAYCLEDGSKIPPDLKETCERWGNAGFGQYCQTLQQVASRLLQKASNDVLNESEVVFRRVLEHEVDFWNMSRGDI